MATVDYIESWQTRLRSRLYTQFRDAASWQSLVDEVLAPQFQDLEDAGQTLLTLLDIDASEGEQLKVIGRVIGQPNVGVDDATYRLYLKARVLANRSTGTAEEIYSIMRALFGTGTQPRYTPGWVKSFAIRIAGVTLTRTQALVAAGFLGDSKEAGARAVLEWRESDSDEVFTLWDAAQLAVAVTAGVLINSISVTSTSGYPSSGYLTFGGEFDAGFFMNGSTSTTFTTTFGFTPLRSYPVGTPIGMLTSEVGEVDVGLDEGNFAGAIEA